MRINLTAAVVAVGLCLIVVGVASSAVTTAQHATYSLKPCSTCREVRYPTEQECQAAALAEAQRVGETRTTGSAVYTCITRFNVIATFQPAAVVRSATLSWTAPTLYTNGDRLTDIRNYKIVVGTSPTNLDRVLETPAGTPTSFTITDMTPGTWYFAVRAVAGSGVESANSNVVSKVVL